MRYKDVTVSGAHNINQPYAELVGYICARYFIRPSYIWFWWVFLPFIKCWLKSVSDSGFSECYTSCAVSVKWRGTNHNRWWESKRQSVEVRVFGVLFFFFCWVSVRISFVGNAFVVVIWLSQFGPILAKQHMPKFVQQKSKSEILPI